MKRFKIMLVLLLSLSLSGCIQEYNLTEEQNNEIAEYMAALILKYDKNYDHELISEDEINSFEDVSSDTSNNITSSTHTTEDSVQNNATDNATLTEVIGAKNFSVKFKGYELADIYPGDAKEASFSLSPREGYQLLVASFAVKNKKDSEQELNLIRTDATYRLIMNDNTEYKPNLTLLKNDLQYIDITIAGGKSEEVLLIFEVPKDIDITNLQLKVTNGDKSATINLK